MSLEGVNFPRKGYPHGALGTGHDHFRWMSAFLEAHEFTKTRLENSRQTGCLVALLVNFFIQLVQILIFPETPFEQVGLFNGQPQVAPFLENHRPGNQRQHQQQQHNQLYQHTGIGHQV